MAKWPKPSEGSWTAHYPDLGTGPVSFRDSTSPEFYELEREAVFKRAWLNVGRVEEVPRVGSYFTKEIDAANASVIVVKGRDERIRAFYNICRHRGNKLVWNDYPNEETKGVCRQFTCKYHAWRYGLDGELKFVQQESEFFGLDRADYGLSPVQCDVWNGFIFINFDPEPRQGLREFLGPMITALDDYPFEMMTERYDFVAHNNSNWKIFADAFQEYYHVPSLHSQQVPSEVRQPNATFECGHFQIDGPHRLVSTAGTRRWLLAPEFMYPVERATRSGLVGPWRTPETHQSAGLNPGGIEPWGITNFQIFPNLEILIYHGWYLLYRYWPTSHNTHKFEAYNAFHPARTVRERIEHEVASVVLKEFALQDAGMLGGTQAALEYDIVDDYPLSDQEILVRHLHKVSVDWVEAYQREHRPVGGLTMADTRLPSAFAEFERFAEKWCLATEPERWEARLATPMPDIHAFYDAFTPRFEEAIDYCDKFPLDDVPEDALNLLHLVYSMIMVSMAVEVFGTQKPADAADAVIDRVSWPVP